MIAAIILSTQSCFCAKRFARAFSFCVALATPALAQQPVCREHKPPTGDIGIGGFQCVASGCGVNGEYRGRYSHNFSAEPYVWDIDPKGPSAGLLKDGDRIVSVDGLLITTPMAGDRLANMKPGTPVSLRLRRGDRIVGATVIPRLGCNMPWISVTTAHGRPRPPSLEEKD